MAIEQSKVLGKDVHPHAAKAATSAVRNKTAAQDAKPGAGFAAVLASADVEPQPTSVAAPTATPAATKNAQHADAAVSRVPKSERAATTDVPPEEDQDTSRTVQKTDAKSPRKSVGQETAGDDAPLRTPADTIGRESIVLTAPLPGVTALAAEGAGTPVPGDAPSDNMLSPVAGGAAGHGYMRTGQLQQTLAMSSDKSAGSRAFLGAGARVSAAVDAPDGAATHAAIPAAAMDLRSNALGKALGGSEPALDSGAKMMSLMASVALQAERGAGPGGERRGQEEGRGAASSAVQETWNAEPADSAGPAAAGFSMEDAPVQETVRYWVGADTKQQAALTVADVAGGAVDVTIHMHGKEAQVSFRADEQQARDALQASSNQLKQMLGQEGLTLSGLSVGTSSAGQEGRQEPRPGGGPGKIAKVAAVAAAPALAPPRTSAIAPTGRGSTLDLFV